MKTLQVVCLTTAGVLLAFSAAGDRPETDFSGLSVDLIETEHGMIPESDKPNSNGTHQKPQGHSEEVESALPDVDNDPIPEEARKWLESGIQLPDGTVQIPRPTTTIVIECDCDDLDSEEE